MKAHIVQYVGFTTELDFENFVHQWKPFVNQCKSFGVVSIDLYEVKMSKELNFISRNVWTTDVYLRNFPTGIAGASGSSDILVTQLGGFWLQTNQLKGENEMKLLFLNQVEKNVPPEITSRLRVSEKVPHKQLLFFPPQLDFTIPDADLDLHCKHLKRM
jgi:hypothetical protein